MSAIFLLIGVSLVVALGFLIAFLWAVNTGQYEDEYTPSVRMLFEEHSEGDITTNKNNQQHNTTIS